MKLTITTKNRPETFKLQGNENCRENFKEQRKIGGKL